MSNSALVSYTKISPNRTVGRNAEICRISPHCVVGQLSVQSLGKIFASTAKQASCNYGIGYDGKVGLYCEEKDRSWCTSSSYNDNRAVTIECASDAKDPYAFNSIVYNKLIDLCVDICKRNGKTKLLWINNATTALNYEPKDDEMVLTVHRWYANKECPGDWMYARMGDLAEKVTDRLSGDSTPQGLYRVRKSWGDSKSQLGAYSVLDNAKKKADANKGYYVFDSSGKCVYPVSTSTSTAPAKKSIDAIAKEIINGTCSDSRWSTWGNGDTRKARLKAAGYNYSTVQDRVNEMLAPKKKTNTEIAREIINGTCSDSRWETWGTGDTRYSRLKKAGYDADAVQKIVNKLMK